MSQRHVFPLLFAAICVMPLSYANNDNITQNDGTHNGANVIQNHGDNSGTNTGGNVTDLTNTIEMNGNTSSSATLTASPTVTNAPVITSSPSSTSSSNSNGTFTNNGQQTTTVTQGSVVGGDNTNILNAAGGQGGQGGAGGNGGAGGKGGQGGAADAHSNSAAAATGGAGGSSSATAAGGNLQNSGNVVGSSSVVIKTPKPLPPAPGVLNPNASAPTLFESAGLPANAKGVDLALRFMRACPPTYTKGKQLREVREKGASGRTNLIFTPHSNYARYGNDHDVKNVTIVELSDNTDLSALQGLTCLGLLQNEAQSKDAEEVPVQTVMIDALKFSGEELEGFDKIVLIFLSSSSISVNMGLNADAQALGISPGLSGMLGQALGTAVGGFSKNSGNTFPVAQLGGTFLVFAEKSRPVASTETSPRTTASAVRTEKRAESKPKKTLAKDFSLGRH